MQPSAFRTSTAAGVAVQATTYALALAIAVLGTRWVAGLDPGLFDEPLVVILVADLIATVVVFCASVAANNSSLYDPYWSLQPLAIVGYYLWLQPSGAGHGVAAVVGDGATAAVAGFSQLGTRELLVAALVLLYSLRLTSNFLRDWPGLSKEDFRYVGFRRRFGRLYWPVSFFGIHLFPTIMVYLGCLPLRWCVDGPGIFSTARGVDGGWTVDMAEVPLNWIDALALIVTLGAVVLAFVADEQLRRFRHDPANRGACIRTGLWRYSRHPNYLGEVLFWWGLYLFALATGWWVGPRGTEGPGYPWWSGAGAVAITLLFVFVSVPMMERRELTRRGGYADYQRVTPMLLPLRLGRRRSSSAAP